MTTGRDYAPVLDRVIQREVSTEVEVPATTTYAYDAPELMSGRIDDGEWRRDSDTELGIGLNDSNGLSFPDLTLPTNGVEVAWDGATATILNVTGMEILRDPFTFAPLGILLTFDGTLPAAGTALTIMVPSGGTQTVTRTAMRNEWAQRRDYRARDFLTVSETGGLITITATRFIVRAEGPEWSTGDTFTDDKGETQTVQGIGEIGRKRWLELRTAS